MSTPRSQTVRHSTIFPTLGYVPALDGLRALAIALVVLYHLNLTFFAGGNDGVDVFFVLSGFLITTLLLQEQDRYGRLTFSRFYVRRFSRLVPALVIVLLVTTVSFTTAGITHDGFSFALLSAFFYLTPVSRFLLHLDDVFDYTWTLAIEEWFYLAWPATLLVTIKRDWTWKFSAATLTLITLFLYFLYAVLDLAGQEISLLRVAGISAGCAYAFAHRHVSQTKSGGLVAAVGLSLIALGTALGAHESLWPISFPTVAVGSLLAVRGVLCNRDALIARILSVRPLVYLGAISYELYLWHYPIFQWFERALNRSPLEVWWVAVPVALGLASSTHELAWRLQRLINASWARKATAA